MMVGGCYGARPGLEAPSVVPCETDAECRSGQSCLRTANWSFSICWDRCAADDNRCDNGALCAAPRVGAEFIPLCQYGAGLPGTWPVADPCTNWSDCPFGETCRRDVFGNPPGTCEPVCGTDEDCARGEGCQLGYCHPICDFSAPDSCPGGYGCTYTGECKPEEELADCPPRNTDGVTPPNVPNNCPVGTLCIGSDEMFGCDDRSNPDALGNCPPGQQQFANNRCYPRSELRPVR